MKKMINFAERYTEYWINESCKCHNVFLNEKEIEEYVRKYPQGTMILTSLVELDCKGHTYKQIMGLDPLDCGVKHGFIEHPKLHFIKNLFFDLIDCFRPSFYRQDKN